MKNKELRILAVIPTGFCYGLQIGTIEFFSRFPDEIKSHFLLTRWGNGEFEKLLNRHGIPYSYSWIGMFSRKMDWKNIRMSLLTLFKLPRLYYDFIKLIRKQNPDILFFANHHELILLYPVLRFIKKKVVCHMHDPSPAIKFQKKTFSYYGKRVDQFISITESVRQRTIALGCDPEKIKTIRMSTTIHPERNFGRKNEFCEKAGWPQNVFIIGITGQMTLTKGVLDVVEAFKLVNERNPATRLVIGGKPIEPFYTELKQHINNWNLEHLVYFPGWLPDVTSYFHNIDVHVLASRHEEGLGLTIAEAMVASVPVVITKSGGAVELVDDGVTGFVVEKANPRQMGEKLNELSENSELYRLFARAARTRVETYFNIDKEVKVMVELFYSLTDPNVR